MRDFVFVLILVGASACICYLQAKKKRRNTVLAIVLGLFLNWIAVIGYLLIPALPESSVVPPDADLQGRRSVRSGSIGVVVALISSLVVWGLAGSLTGGEGDLGPGLMMLSVYAGSIIAVSYLGVAAIWRGVSSLRKVSEPVGRSRARFGIALGALDLGAVVAAVLVAAGEVAANA